MPDNDLLSDPAPGRAVAVEPGALAQVSDRGGRLALSFAQQRLWFLTRLPGVSQAYHMPLAMMLTGTLDAPALQAALDALVARHQTLRSRFEAVDGEPFCLIDPPGTGFALRVEDLTVLAEPAQRQARLAELQAGEASAPFDLATGPLVRGRLLKLADDQHVLLVTMHHIVSDGWSMAVFTRELGQLYTALVNDAEVDASTVLPALPLQYADYAGWQRQWLTGPARQRQADYWQHTLTGAPALLELPTDRPRPAEQDLRGRQVRIEFDTELTARLTALGQRHGATLYMTVLTGWAIVLSRLSGQSDLVIGTPTANRRRAELEELIGFFVNTLPLRIDLTDHPTASQLLHRVQHTTLTALDHQDLPFEHLVELTNPTRSLAHTPIFQTMFAWQNNEESELALPGITVRRIGTSYTVAKFDLTLSLAEQGGRIVGVLDYASALFDPATAQRYVRYLQRVLTALVADPDRTVDALSLINPPERQQLLAERNQAFDYPVTEPIHRQVEAQAALRPDAIAVSCEGRQLTYRQLNQRANQLAHHLHQHRIGPDSLIAICLPRTAELIIGLLAILKAGAAYLPLDPANPPDRLAYLIADSAPALALVDQQTRPVLAAALAAAPEAELPLVDLDKADWTELTADQPPATEIAPDQLAYVIYTSGSTGRPKGVLVEHANVLRLFAATARRFHFGTEDVWTLFHSFAFDFSVWEIWGALRHGGRLVVVPQLISRSPADFYRLLCEQGVTVLNQTPSAFGGLIAAQADSAAEHRLRTVIFGGEALDPTKLAPWYRDARNQGTELVNMYGITETTVHVSYRPLSPADAEHPGASPIGGPIDDLRIYLLDPAGEPVPVGVVGELYVGGAGVARGYLNRPELTAQRFLASPFVPGDRLYRTGDLARYRPDGSLDYLGRNDYQVKIRGYRVELGEVAARLAACPGVRDAVVLARPGPGDAPDRLIGYYLPDTADTADTADLTTADLTTADLTTADLTTADLTAATEPADPAALRAALAAVLPEHMVPAGFVRVDAWPLTANGKLDRDALPAPDDAALGARRYRPPQGPVEQALAEIWAELLGVNQVGRDDHFFALGGHSLLALRLLDRMRRQGLHADVRALFSTPTLAALAAAVGAGPAPTEVPPNLIPAGCQQLNPELLSLVSLDQAEIDTVVATVAGGAANVADIYPLAPVQEGILFHHLMTSRDDPYLVSSLIRFENRATLDGYCQALQAVIDRHDVLRTGVVFHGLRQPVQVVWRQAPLVVEQVELDPAGGEPGDQLRAAFAARYGRLALDQAPLLRLLVTGDPAGGPCYALELIHHIIDDNTSLKQLGAEIRAHLAGRADQLPAPLPFRDFVAFTSRGPGRAEHAAFFGELLGDIDSPSAPFGLLDVHGDGQAMRQLRHRLEPDLSSRLRARAQQLGVSVASLFHVAWGQVLARACDRPDVVFGTVLFGRMQASAGSDRVLGPFINTLPIRISLGEVAAEHCARATHAALTGLIEHEHASLADAQRASAVPPPAPLFTSLLNYRHTARATAPDADTEQIPGLTYLAADERSNYPLALDVDDHGQDFGLTVALAGPVDPELVLAMTLRALATLADALEHAPDSPIGRLDVLPTAERQRLLQLAGPVDQDPVLADRLLHQLFEAEVARDPDAIALVAGDRQLSYRDLNAQANRLAHHLRELGVGPDRLVALCLQRSAEAILGMLAVLKAGGGYLPLDPSYPANRLAAMLADSAPTVVLTHAPARDALAAALTAGAGQPTPVIDLDREAAGWAAQPVTDPVVPGLTPDRLAYLIYTSGTTGAANGVLVEHRQLAGIAAAWQPLLDLGPNLVHLQMASLSFDVCTADLVRSLCFGGRLVLCPRELLADPAGLHEFCQRHRVNFADFVPAVLEPLLTHLEQVDGEQAGTTMAGFQTVICGSDAWPVGLAGRLRARCGPAVRIINAYGVTEAAVDSTHYLLPADPAELANLPIGRPLPGVRAYLLDSAGEPVPDGVTGELYLGGLGVARGYLNRPELTARRFLASPFVAGDRLYRTGDLARRLPGGDLEFHGRRDFQVKLRGLRVELGEIEAALAGCPGVREAVVIARTDGTPADTRLVGYYLTEPGTAPTAEDLRERLASVLPAHLVPAGLVSLEAWPLTPNGKLDRAALPAPTASPGNGGYQSPIGPVEIALAALWAELLGLDRVGRHDHFFALGGHSLLAMRLVGQVRHALGREVSPAALFAAPTLAGFAEQVQAIGGEVLPPIRPSDRAGPLPMSFAQQRLWFLAQLDGVSEAYHMPQAWQLTGPLDAGALARAWDALIARHETLRTRFVSRDGTGYQQVEPTGPALQVEDLTGLDQAQRLAELQAAEASAPFDLATGPLVRGRLLKLAEDQHVLLVTMHHIVSDGWSMAVFTRELGQLYTALATGADPALPELAVQYADYAAWQRDWLTGPARQRQADYWQHTLTGAPALLELPTDRPRPAEQDLRGGQLSVVLDGELTEGLRAVSRAHGCTTFMTVLTGWAIVLSRLSGQTDLVIGTPTANRRRAELEELIGFFVNTLPLRIDLTDHPTASQLLHRVQHTTLTALDHQDLPFEHLVELTNPTRSLAHTPIFQTMLTWQDDEDGDLGLAGVQARPLVAPYPVAKFDLTLSLAEQGGRIVGVLDYASALFDPATAQRYVHYLQRVLTALVADPDRPISTLALTEPAEPERLLALGDGTEEARQPASIQDLFEAQVALAPDAIAVTCEGRQLTYRELNQRANQLAHHLHQHRIGPDSLIAICLPRTAELIIGLLAILKAGAAYLPLDPAYPSERLAVMLADSAPALLLSRTELRPTLPAGSPPVYCLDDIGSWAHQPVSNPSWPRRPDQLAYVIYTSGSTGRPKGVAQTWRCADNLIDWMLHSATPDSRPPGRVLQFASTSFDVSFQEIWSTLCAGATLVLLADEQRGDLAQLRRFIAEQDVQRAFLPAAVLQQIATLTDTATGAQRPRLGCEIITAGEALRVTDDLRALVEQLGGDWLYNHYGPTETHAVTHHPLRCADSADWPALPPIGRPITGARVYLLDDELAPVPLGVVGELYLGGATLARGYLNRPGLTAGKFLPDPFAGPGARMYRSGDLARWLPDGTLSYLGRADEQVKVRGFRVEPGEVETVLQQLAGVRQAAVLVIEDAPGERQLAGYLALDEAAGGLAGVREQVRSQLPDYLVPTRWVVLDQLPLTPNGKLDRRALPAPDPADSGTEYQPPRTPQEAAMATIWAEILRRDRVGVADNFFALGGHSLLATRLVHAINQRMSAHLSLRDLFRNPVLADLAAELGRGGDEAAAYVFGQLQPDPAGRYQPFPLTDIQEAYWVGRDSSIELGGVGAHGYSELRLAELDEQRFSRALHRLIERHDMLRAIFDADGTQRVLADVPPYRMPRLDLRGLPAELAQARLHELREQLSHQVFDAGQWPLFAFALTVLDDELRLHVSIDGLIVDVASSQILERELSLLYADPDAELPPIPVSFRDYVLAERALRDTPRYQRALRYWRDRVAELAPAPGLPLARQPETVQRPLFTRYDQVLSAAQWTALKANATRRGVTPSVLLLTAYAEVLGRWSRHPRFTLSLPLFNRLPLHPQINTVIGDFTSLVLVELDLSEPAGFADRARTVQERLWADIDHAAVSGVRVNRELAQARGTAQAAMPIVFNSTLSELAADAEDGGLAAALNGRAVHSITQTPQVWIDHTVLESAGQLYYNWDSIDELFPAGMVGQMFADYTELLERLAEPAAWQASAASLLPAGQLTPAEPAAAEPAPLLHELFDRRVEQAPDALAVIAPDRQLDYRTLRTEARQLGARLQALGCRPGDLVAVLAERGWQQVVATLAVLYAGGGYLPLDPAWPADRLAHVLERTGSRLALVQPAQVGVLQLPAEVEPIAIEPAGDSGAIRPRLRPVSRADTDLAYVIYTSGSTGRPKGVMIDHRGAVNTLLDVIERFDLGPDDRVLATSSLSFDLSVFDIFATLAVGGAVVTLDPELARDPAHWLELVTAHRVSVWNSVPALFGLLVEHLEHIEHIEHAGQRPPGSLRLAMLSGDWIPVTLPDRARRLLPGCQLHSLGGATEASIWSIHHPIGAVDPSWRSIPYGRAMRHQQFHVLDGQLRPRPTWAVGELYIGGIGLAQGYWRDEQTTAASFICHPVTGQRLYRTGDLGRLLPDGNIEFLGRDDGQVKIHGYRVELGEIEAALQAHPAVRAAAVRLFGDAHGDKRLAGYVVAGNSAGSTGLDATELDSATLADHLAGLLPGYMVPASFTVLDALPLSANGKVDKSRLPEPAAPSATGPAGEDVQALASPAEQRLVEAVERVLGRTGIALQANLLRLGATSIDIVRIGNALQTELGFRPKLARLMRQPSLAELLAMFQEFQREQSVAEAAQRIAAGTTNAPVTEDPAARAEFKAQGQGRRRFGDTVPSLALPAPAEPSFVRRYLDYRSTRQFAPVPVDGRDLAGLLANLSARAVAGNPKYLYGSAGGAYPVQAYLYVKPGRVAGVPAGAHYYDPYRHRLVQLGPDRQLDPDAYDYFVNRPVFQAGAFALFLVAELAAIEPLYGEASLGFCQIEAGGIAQLLTMTASEHQLGLCGIGSVEPAVLAALFDLGPTHRLIYSMIGGARPAEQLTVEAVGELDPATADDGSQPDQSAGDLAGELADVEMEDVEL